MDTIFSILVVVGICYGAYRGIKWMLHAGQIQARKDPPLSPADLKVLEESAARLMADLRAVTDECIARIESACADAERHIRPQDIVDVEDIRKVSQMDTHDKSGEFDGLTNGEIELLKGLKAISR
ncbi:hypothetical protein LLG46_02785 [bacterium]|nr:hypothetical protein [bacterium]